MRGNAKSTKDAINYLVSDGYAEVVVEGRSHMLKHVRTYIEPKGFDV